MKTDKDCNQDSIFFILKITQQAQHFIDSILIVIFFNIHSLYITCFIPFFIPICVLSVKAFMKKIPYCLFFFFFFSCANGKETTYTGSTPAGPLVRSFLGIPLRDSVDFIRWQLVLDNNSYKLHCNYGIGKPNTNGFINGGKTIELTGAWNKEKIDYQVYNGNKILKLAELNTDLLHVMDESNNLLVGNGGWSYTLNNVKPLNTDEINITGLPAVIKDSLAFEGRTPCNVPGIIPAGTECYKLKWYIVLYAGSTNRQAGTYRVYGTKWRQQGGRTGNWQIKNGKKGSVIYQLNDDKGKGFIYLLKVDEHILLFTDADEKLLVGDEDFSYTMNSIVKQ